MNLPTNELQPSDSTFETIRNRAGWLKRIAATAAVAAFAAGLAPSASVAQEAGTDTSTTTDDRALARIEAGTLACKGEGGWGAIIYSKKTFDCTFTTADQSASSSYKGTITKVGLDLGVTGDTALVWLVLGSAEEVVENLRGESLAGDYVGVGVEATAGAGLGANVLVGGSDSHFALQPLSVQVQTGLSVAAAVQTLTLEYLGPVN